MSLTAAPTRPATTPDRLPTAHDVVCHTLLNTLLREVIQPEGHADIIGDHLLIRLVHTATVLRIPLRRTSVFGAHRFHGLVEEQQATMWSPIGWERLAEAIHAELSARTGVDNDEFLDQVRSSYDAIAATLAAEPTTQPDATRSPYLQSEQSLLFGHRFHPTPKARTGAPTSWASYAPEMGAAFPLHYLAVRDHLVIQETAHHHEAGIATVDALDHGRDDVPDGYRLLPVHPWQRELLADHPPLHQALAAGDIIDLGPGDHDYAATASVRTLYDGTDFLKFSLDVRITNCVRKNASYELTGAVAMTRELTPIFTSLEERYPGFRMLREPAYRSIALPGPDGQPDRTLLEGFGVIVREGFDHHLSPGVTPLLAGAIADEYPTGPAHLSHLLAHADITGIRRWWDTYLRLLVPPVLSAYLDYGLVFEPHLQNVVVGVDPHGRPTHMIFRDLEGTKLLPEHHHDLLRRLPADVADAMTYDADRGWDRVTYCLFVNHLSEVLSALADLAPDVEETLWADLREVLVDYADAHQHPQRVMDLLDGAPLPAKTNLLTRWARKADRHAGYVRMPSPLAAARYQQGDM
ncbi:L-2,3-diaminopropanoate--citrate ligase [Austwickia sp. TVS 96-490-7B]|uniref:IucA/IucC family protein n=1 Tax=Austwickia sp. TVS 96-490-7B TaxID=2830843 RepID=UPI001C574602|nr:IucA/IucC family protein [Austwickia sp. TVS 96-490-7B]MBW3086822.1 L-2,3-diaminopropanoate--citrate ligase [Austwickia sp. TVS 96-490-7B]